MSIEVLVPEKTALEALVVVMREAAMASSIAWFLRWVADETFLVQCVARGIKHGFRQGMNETLFKGYTNDGA